MLASQIQGPGFLNHHNTMKHALSSLPTEEEINLERLKVNQPASRADYGLSYETQLTRHLK
jgi:hypothetical protein